MLTRLDTDPTKILRRTQSITSVGTASTTHQRYRTSLDHRETQLQAEAAAAEAYRRAQDAQSANVSISASQQRKKGHRTSEGSHLADARLGRRRSTAVRDDRKKGTPMSDIKRSRTDPGCESKRGTNNLEHNARNGMIRPRSTRRPPSTTSQGSPTPRKKTALDPQVLAIPSHFQDFSYDAEPSSEVLTLATPSHEANVPQPSIRETQTDEDIMNIARDKCLQDFQQHKLRERKSFFLGSIQRLRNRQATAQEPQSFVVDSSVPPFNQAADDAAFVLPPTHSEETSCQPQTIKRASRSRTISSSLKSRLLNMLRKTTPQRKGMPPQHVEARHLHLSITGDNLDCIGSRQDYEQFAATIAHGQLSETTGAVPPLDYMPSQDNDTSRVTSWANSTVAGTTSAQDQDSADRPTSLDRSGSVHTLRKRSSFFGKSVQNRLRKSSRSDLNSTEQSQSLFTALQTLIQSSNRKEQATLRQTSDCSERSRVDSAICTLPSQQTSMSASSSMSHRASMVRAITPDEVNNFRTMSPLVEVMSPGQSVDGAAVVKSQDNSGAWNVVRPSVHQITSRVARSQARWRSSLDPIASANDMTTINPYELTPIPMQAQSDMEKQHTGVSHHTELPHHTGLPHHVRINPATASQALSPSVYSQGSEFGSRTATPEMPAATMVTITGREVKRYTISPGKVERKELEARPVQVSSEWRRWLSDEIRGFAVPPMLEQTEKPSTKSFMTGSSSPAECSAQSQQTPDSTMLLVEGSRKPGNSRTARPAQQRSSFMNDRYPTIDSSRNSSRSVQSRSSSHQADRPLDGGDTSIINTQSSPLIGDHPRHVHHQQQGDSAPAMTRPTSIVNTATRSTTHKAQSTTELRARFKSSLSGTARPIGIQRKSMLDSTTIMADETIQNISAGPYASDTSSSMVAKFENTPPRVVSDNRLPALSSSEWLGGPTTKQRAKDLTSWSERVATSCKASSPGQRLATGWLEGRIRERGSSPAFV